MTRALRLISLLLLLAVQLCSVEGITVGSDGSDISHEQAHAQAEDHAHIEPSGAAPEFVATHEWQEIQEGQAVPKGLHVKMDFESGRK